MKLRLLAALLGAVALPCAALAAPPAVPTGTFAVTDANKVNQSEIIIPQPGFSGSGPAPFYLGHSLFGENSITGGFQPGVMDGTDYGLWTHTVNGATATGQATTNSLLGQLAGAVNGTNINVNCTSGCSGSSSGGSVTVTSSALPNGAATSAGQANIVNALTPTGGFATSEKNSAAIAANTAPGGSGALTAIGTPATNGTALAAGPKGTELYLNANDTVTLAIEPASVCGNSAPSYTATVQGGSSGAVIPEALTGQVMCVTAKTGTPGSRPY